MSSPWKFGSSLLNVVDTISGILKPTSGEDEATPERRKSPARYRLLSNGDGDEGDEITSTGGSELATSETSLADSFFGSGSNFSFGKSEPWSYSSKRRRCSEDVETGSRKRRKEGKVGASFAEEDELSEPESDYTAPLSSINLRAAKIHHNHAYCWRANMHRDEAYVLETMPGFSSYPLILPEDILEPWKIACRKVCGTVACKDLGELHHNRTKRRYNEACEDGPENSAKRANTNTTRG